MLTCVTLGCCGLGSGNGVCQKSVCCLRGREACWVERVKKKEGKDCLLVYRWGCVVLFVDHSFHLAVEV